MSNLVDDNTCYQNPFPTESELYIRVAKRPLGWCNVISGEYVSIDKQVAIVREHAGGGKWLSNVGENYKLIENRDLFPHVEQHMMSIIAPEHIKHVEVVEHMSYNGRDCYREYRFPSLKCETHGEGDVSYRVIVGNSYGGKAVSLLTGAIDFFCSNGMIIGQSEKQARKHTSKLEVTGLDAWLTASVDLFAAHGKRIERYTHTPIDLTKEDALFDYLVEKGLLSSKRARDAMTGMHRERNIRAGRDNRPTLWHLYSTLTDWASHSEVRDTGNDHTANTRIQRTKHAEQVIKAADEWVNA